MLCLKTLIGEVTSSDLGEEFFLLTNSNSASRIVLSISA